MKKPKHTGAYPPSCPRYPPCQTNQGEYSETTDHRRSFQLPSRSATMRMNEIVIRNEGQVLAHGTFNEGARGGGGIPTTTERTMNPETEIRHLAENTPSSRRRRQFPKPSPLILGLSHVALYCIDLATSFSRRQLHGNMTRNIGQPTCDA
ncbi:hypothetical protein DFP72DRAFT_171559 [Ephemerocybe angulata]|uniref:Uncharacterized protein n=1 Tax=Ephemerocybe angulata TaxID=980116 RepID=A0A8H6LVW3_9AGAR|nr:hypothetical protein DFP72DRAFT_171559 [Tulosesus angulatus]